MWELGTLGMAMSMAMLTAPSMGINMATTIIFIPCSKRRHWALPLFGSDACQDLTLIGPFRCGKAM